MFQIRFRITYLMYYKVFMYYNTYLSIHNTYYTYLKFNESPN